METAVESVVNHHECKVCGTPDQNKPMCFRGETWCSERHRKVLNGDFGYDINALVDAGHIRAEDAGRLWGLKLSFKALSR